MPHEEYRKRMQEDDEWAPGWDAIYGEFARLYPGTQPVHYATDFSVRAILGGDEYLGGYSIYDSGKGHQHIVTYGMSELYANEEAFGAEYSRRGYEMTVKLKAERPEECLWALCMLSNLARYTYKSKLLFEAGDCIPGNGTSLHQGPDSSIRSARYFCPNVG